MGFLDVILGRSKPVRPDLDQLFALPSAAVTLQAAAGFVPTGAGSVCFASVEGGAFKQIRQDVQLLLDAPVEYSQDAYGYTWLLARHAPQDTAGLVNDLHAVNTLLEESGFGPQLLCSLLGFRDDPGQAEDQGWGEGRGRARDQGEVDEQAQGRALALVYLYKRGTFYPFAPLAGAGEKRDNALELQVRATLTDDLVIEKELTRWFPVWGAPGL
ncbi:hypothetical protein [Streptomyces sp. MST-110588]|uniref:PspA-associated protein PspAB n=1 Tax=Streptomyces sp. MST-110588 TaxID=2833628 RepID=UPI001F5DC248|nr:hypothetical protein [Streptomyces sp. MST-110588]UNO40899.1 hypothetical protein KGS77_16585 [Streptomyces sp. MST-110588]